MASNFPKLIEERSDERLLQGLLKHALEMDRTFLRAFCKWLGYQGNPKSEIIEELSAEEKRPDLTIPFEGDDKDKTIELKINAIFTKAQKKNKKVQYSNHLIAPNYRLDECGIYFWKEQVKTWEEFCEKFSTNPTIKVLFFGLEKYIRSGSTISIKEIQEDFKKWIDGGGWFEDSISSFLRRIRAEIQSEGKLITTASSGGINIKKPYWGCYIKRKNLKSMKDLWIGFCWNKIEDSPIQLLFLCPKDLGSNNVEKFFISSSFESSNLEIVIEPDQGNKYTAVGVLKKIKTILNKYSNLEG